MTAVNIWVFLSGLSIQKREKKDRLRLLSLSGCSGIGDVDKFELDRIFVAPFFAWPPMGCEDSMVVKTIEALTRTIL